MLGKLYKRLDGRYQAFWGFPLVLGPRISSRGSHLHDARIFLGQDSESNEEFVFNVLVKEIKT